MARARAALGNGARLTDFLSTRLLARVYPSSLIGDLLDTRKCNSQRQRSFSATAAVYYCMALSLYPEAAYGVFLTRWPKVWRGDAAVRRAPASRRRPSA